MRPVTLACRCGPSVNNVLLLFGQTAICLKQFQVAGELRPRILQYAQHMLHLRVAVFLQQAAGVQTRPGALVVKLHDVPRRQPGLCAGACCICSPLVAAGCDLVHRERKSRA